MSEAVIRLAGHEADHPVVLGTDDEPTAPRCADCGDAVRACIECGKVKHLGQFAKDASKRGERRRMCAVCRTDYDRRRDYARRARHYGHTPVIEKFSTAQLVERYGEHCYHCGTGPFETVDHLTPVRIGGRHTQDNSVPSCGACNRRKRWREDKVLIEAFLALCSAGMPA